MRALSLVVAPVLVAAGLAVVPMAEAPNASAGCVKTNGISVCDSGSESGVVFVIAAGDEQGLEKTPPLEY